MDMRHPMSEAETFDEIIAMFRERTGITYSLTRRGDAITGIREVMAKAGLANPRQFLRQITHDDELFTSLVERLVVAETYFFRHIGQFDEIRNRIVPDLRALRGPDARLRVWSAGCSSGEEAYSLAILFEQETIGAQILATDISQRALTKAKQANYGAWSLRGEGRQASNYLESPKLRLAIPDRLQSRVDFRQLNLMSDTYPAITTGTNDLDLIVCRNVLIYFDDDGIRSIAKRFRDCLAPGGWLLTGPSDPPLWDIIDLELITTTAGILYHKPSSHQAAFAIPGRATARDLPAPFTPRADIAKRDQTPLPRKPSPPAADTAARKATTSDNASSGADHIRMLADKGKLSEAMTASETAIAQNPTAPELHYLRAVALLAQDRDDDAYEALRRVIYLDRSLEVAHFAMGTVLLGRGDPSRARRAFQRAFLLSSTRNPDDLVPFGNGEKAQGLAQAARAQIERLNQHNHRNGGPRVL